MPDRSARLNPAVRAVQLTLDRPRNLIFDLNAYTRFDQVSGKFFLPIIMKLQRTVIAGSSVTEEAGLQFEEWLKEISLADIRSLIWAAQAYAPDALSLEEVGSYLTDLPKIFDAIRVVFRGITVNQPTMEEIPQLEGEEELGDAGSSEPGRPLVAPPEMNGGAPSGPSLDTT